MAIKTDSTVDDPEILGDGTEYLGDPLTPDYTSDGLDGGFFDSEFGDQSIFAPSFDGGYFGYQGADYGYFDSEMSDNQGGDVSSFDTSYFDGGDGQIVQDISPVFNYSNIQPEVIGADGGFSGGVMDDISYDINPYGENITENQFLSQGDEVMPITLPPFYVNASPVSNLGFGVFDFNQGFDPETYGFETNIFQGGFGLGDQNTGEIITLPPFVVTENRIETNPIITEPFDDTQQIVVDGGSGGVQINTGPVVTLPPFVVTETRDTTTPLVITAPVNIFTAPTSEPQDTGVVTMTPFIVTENRITTPQVVMTTPPVTLSPTQVTEATGPVTMTPFVVTENRLPTPPPVTIATPSVTLAPITFPPVTTPPVTTAPPTTRPPVTTPPTTAIPQPTGIFGGTTTTSTGTSSAMTERDLAKELEKTMGAFDQYRPRIQQMYGDLYQQFMPKGLSETERGVIDQYKQDLARLQQRQAGMLSPEDVRQSQQAAREAYGARGQVMGRGAIGAEILNREAIRQQREDQARQALQQSYGNILNMSNLQTGNLFSPIASLMSGTFNPLGAYPADVYGTNVNAQLAREIAQKNYEAAVRSAELSGSAQRSAATTSAAGQVLGPALGTVAAKGIGTLFGLPIPSCMPGDQCIDTPNGPKAVKDLKGGDAVIGYNGEVAYIAQACSWNQDPLRVFLTITREDGSSFTVCDDHKVMGIPAMEWVEGAELAGSRITAIEKITGLLTSYDILTNQGGYRINGIPVNSMIPEIIMQVVEFHRQVDRNLQAASA